MNVFPKSVSCAGLLTLLTTMPLLAADTLPNADRTPGSSGWVVAQNASFNARTYQAPNGDLIVQVNNGALRGLTIQMQTLRGEEVAWVPVPQGQSAFIARLDVSELTDGDYRLIVATDNDRLVKIVRLTSATPTVPARQARVAVVTPSAYH
ncbi:hypothetical protein [Fibrella arboris]|uniref:hypothetical protein n=1 Tax=Fibrella arboris TaxID=3242486 RepID=UPI0035214B0D